MMRSGGPGSGIRSSGEPVGRCSAGLLARQRVDR
jgi:hypothetical protein